MDELIGRWELTGVVEEDPGPGTDWAVEFPDGGDGVVRFRGRRFPLDEMVGRWLDGAAVGPTPPMTAAGGLVLEIDPDASFTETGEAEVAWFDEDGVLCSTAVPFSGSIIGGHLLADGVPGQPLPWRPAVQLRCDDGDTKIADAVTAVDDELVRTVSVVTDELYPSRIRYRYRRA